MHLKIMAVGSVLALSLGTAACQQPTTGVTNNVAGSPEEFPDEPGVENMGSAAVPAGAPQTPAAYVTAITASDLFEIQSGQLAKQKGQSDRVKSLGSMLVDEHTKSSNELKAVLAQSNPPVTPPTSLPADMQARLQSLQGLSGEQFDQRWLAEQTVAHQQTLAAVNGFLAQAEPGPLKDHASKATGVIQKHLNELTR